MFKKWIRKIYKLLAKWETTDYRYARERKKYVKIMKVPTFASIAKIRAYVAVGERPKSEYEKLLSLIFDVKSNEDFCNKLLKCIDKIELPDSMEFEQDYKDVLSLCMDLNADCSTIAGWHALETFTMSFGMFRLALMCREKGNFLQGTQKRWKKGFSNIRMAVEQGDLSSFQIEIEQWEKRPLAKKVLLDDLAVGRALLDCYSSKEWIPNSKVESYSREFAELVKGRRIAIVGPAPMNNYDIDVEYDLVLRINDTGEEHTGTGWEAVKTDISYLAVARAKWLAEQKNLVEMIEPIKALAIRYDNLQNLKGKSDKIKNTVNANRFLTVGSFVMLPVILSDLILYCPKEIYVTGLDLYLGEKMNRDDYCFADINDCPSYEKLGGFAKHNLFSQFAFIKMAYICKAFSANKTISSIMDMTMEEYAEGLEKIYLKRSSISREGKNNG